LVCFYFRIRRDASDVEYSPAFAKVGFDGKIRFASGPVGGDTAANGHCVVSESHLGVSDQNCAPPHSAFSGQP